MSQQNRPHNSHNSKKILCYGDSNTFGYDPRDGGRYSKKFRWVDIISQNDYVAINEGLNGREIPTSKYEYGYLNAIFNKNSDADLIILALGVNDAYNMHNPDANKIADRWRETINNVKAFDEIISKKIPVILVSPPVGDTKTWGGEKADRITDALKELATEYKMLCEEYGFFFLDAEKWGVELAFDGVHFTEMGNAVFAKNILELIESIFYGN